MKNIALTEKKTLASCEAGEMFKANGTKVIYYLESIVNNVYTVARLRNSCIFVCGSKMASERMIETMGRAF